MRRTRFLALLLTAALALAPALAQARAGHGGSFGSRGARTWSAPHSTGITPYSAAPMQRSITPRMAQPAPGYAAPARAPYYGRHSPFMSGFLGGLIGAGIGGLLLGHGFFHGGLGGFGFLGFLLQIFILVMIVRWLLRRFLLGRGPAFAGPGIFPRGAQPRPMPGGGSGARPVTLTPVDYQAFERILYDVQAAWSAQDLGALHRLATPEMVSYFGEQLAEQASRGQRNVVSDVRLEKGELSEAWSEGSREYATLALRYSMLDVTTDSAGRIVDGSTTTRSLVTELWTFVRAPGAAWLLSAIQQTR